MAIDAKEIADKFMKLIAMGIEDKGMYYKSGFDKNISQRQMEILFRVTFLKQTNITTLAESMSLSKSTVSIVVNKLVEKDYLSRNHSKSNDDKRKVYFYITDKGRGIIEQISEYQIDRLNKNYMELTQKGKKLFDEAMELFSQLINGEALKFHEIMEDTLNGVEKISILHFKAMTAVLQICAPVFKNVFGEENAGGKLTEKQFRVLVAVHILGQDTVTKLEKFFSVSGSSASIIVLRLETAGLLIKDRGSNENDRRITRLRLTQEGITVLNNVYGNAKAAFFELFSKKSETELDLINKACDKLFEAAKESPSIKAMSLS